MFVAKVLATIFLPAALLLAIYGVARALEHQAFAYISLLIDVAAAAAGIYFISMGPTYDLTESSGASFLLSYTLGIGLLVAGVRVAYESWKIR
jgi:hypothetical protein